MIVKDNHKSRREFLQHTGRIAAATALAGVVAPSVHAAEANTIQVALIGCGGRGTGAAVNALSVRNGPTRLVAMADVFPARLKDSYEHLKREQVGSRVDVPAERKFIGFDAYRKAMDCLKPGDVAIFATPLGFRWVHFAYAVEKGLNVFMEKPLTADGPTSRRMLKLAEDSVAKNLKVGVGLMSRHAPPMQELARRIQDGEIGELILVRGYRMHGPAGSFFSLPKPPGISELLYQIQRFHSFLWAGGGAFSDALIHIIDHCCWMKNAWPVKRRRWVAANIVKVPTASPTSTRTSITTPWNTPFPMRPSSLWTAGSWRGAMSSIPASRTAPRAWPSSPSRAIAVPLRPRIGARVRAAPNCFGNRSPTATIRTPIRSNGTSCSTPSATTNPTTRPSGVSRPAWRPRWAAWPPIPERKSPSTPCSTASMKWRRTWPS